MGGSAGQWGKAGDNGTARDTPSKEADLASRTGRVAGSAKGAVPGIAILFIGIVIGEEGGIILGALGILLAIIGSVVGAVVGGSTRGADGSHAPIVGAIIGTIPGLLLFFVITSLAFPIILGGALIGWFVGTRIGH